MTNWNETRAERIERLADEDRSMTALVYGTLLPAAVVIILVIALITIAIARGLGL